MRVLRLSNSADWFGSVPEAERSPALADAALATASGEVVETVTRAIWPTPDLPDVLDGWLAKQRPDLVFLWVAPYWFTFENMPQPRKLTGTAPKMIGRVAKRAGVKRLITRRYGQLRRTFIRRRGGSSLLFQPEAVLDSMTRCIERILRYEDATLVVRGPEFPLVLFQDKPGRRLAEQRRLVVHRGLAALCSARHVTYLGVEDGLANFDRGGHLMADGIHRSAAGHLQLGGEEAEAMVKAWLAANGRL